MTREAAERERLLLVQSIEEAYNQRAWHGPNLRGALRGVQVESASWRPAPGRHNIWEIALHAAYWKEVVRRRMSGDRRRRFPIPGSNWFEAPDPLGKREWPRDLALLQTCHDGMLDEIRKLDPTFLDRRVGKSPQTFRQMLRGMAMHDVYHAGQIQTLKSLQK